MGEARICVPDRRYGSIIFDWIGIPIGSPICMSFNWFWDGCGAAAWDADCDAAADGTEGGGGGGWDIGDIGDAWRSCDMPSSDDVTFWSHILLFTGLKFPMGGVIGDELSAEINRRNSIVRYNAPNRCVQ